MKFGSIHHFLLRNGCFALSKFLTMPNESYRQRMKQADAEVGKVEVERLVKGGYRRLVPFFLKDT